MSKKLGESEAKTLMMPADVRAIQVISMLDELEALGAGTPINKVAERVGGDISVFLPILSAAEMLGLVRSENGNLFVTEDGLRLQEIAMANLSTLMKGKLVSIEPFRTAVGLASKRGGTTAKEVAGTLAKNGVQWYYEPYVNEELVRNLLIHWAIRAALLSYDGKNGIFRKI